MRVLCTYDFGFGWATTRLQKRLFLGSGVLATACATVLARGTRYPVRPGGGAARQGCCAFFFVCGNLEVVGLLKRMGV